MTVADNIVLSTNIGTGATLRTLSDGTDEWEVAAMAYVTTLSPGANVLQVVTAAFGLPVAQQGSWSVTANAGTNLNTSLLALETGGNLAAIAAHTPALGQQLAAASSPVVLTAIQVAALTPLSTVGITGSVAVTGTFYQTTQPVSGTFWQATQPVSIAAAIAATQSGTWTNTVTQATAASLNATVVGTGTFSVQNTAATPAGTNLLGQVAQSPQVALLYNGTTPVTVQYGTFTTSASGAASLVAAIAGKKIYLLRWSVSSNGGTNVNLQSHTTTALTTGLKYLTQFASGGGAYCPAGIMAAATGEGLDINNSAAVAVSGEYTFVQF